MIDLTYIRGFYPPAIANNAVFPKHILKELHEMVASKYMVGVWVEIYQQKKTDANWVKC